MSSRRQTWLPPGVLPAPIPAHVSTKAVQSNFSLHHGADKQWRQCGLKARLSPGVPAEPRGASGSEARPGVRARQWSVVAERGFDIVLLRFESWPLLCDLGQITRPFSVSLSCKMRIVSVLYLTAWLKVR